MQDTGNGGNGSFGPDKASGWHYYGPAEGTQAPQGWYYHGPQPPEGVAPQQGANREELQKAIEGVARGDFGPETVSRLFAFGDRDFWKGALVGAGVALALNNMPQIKEMFGTLMAGGFGGGLDDDEDPFADLDAAEAAENNEENNDE